MIQVISPSRRRGYSNLTRCFFLGLFLPCCLPEVSKGCRWRQQ